MFTELAFCSSKVETEVHWLYAEADHSTRESTALAAKTQQNLPKMHLCKMHTLFKRNFLMNSKLSLHRAKQQAATTSTRMYTDSV